MKKITLIISSVAVATFSSAQQLPFFSPADGVYQAAGWNFKGSSNDVNDYADDLFTPAAVNASFDTTGLIQVSTPPGPGIGYEQVNLLTPGGNSSNLGDLDYNFNLGNKDAGFLNFQGAVDTALHPNKTFLINFENKWQSFNAEGSFTGLKLQFDLIGGANNWLLPQDVDISIDGGDFTDFTTLNPTSSWSSNTIDLGAYDTADSISMRVTLNTTDPNNFGGVEQPGLGFDNVLFYATGITVVPEPSALALFIPLLAFASLTTRRRR